MDLIPPFAMYFTVEQSLALGLTDATRTDIRSTNPEPFDTRLLFTIWQKLTDESRRDLIEAHDREYDYESHPK